MRNERVARRYAVALMEAAESAGAVEPVAADLEMIAATLDASRELRLLLRSPVVSPAKKRSALKSLFGARVRPVTAELLELLITKKREGDLGDVIAEWFALRDRTNNVVTAGITSALALGTEQEQRLRAELERRFKKTVRLQVTVDPAIRGGLVVRIGDTVLDASVQRQLELLRTRLATGAAE